MIRLLLLCFWCLCLSTSALAKPPPVTDYVRMPMIYDASISPNGQYLGTFFENKGEYIVRLFNLSDLSDQSMAAVSLGKRSNPNWVRWANNETLLVSVGRTDKIGGVIAEFRYLYAINIQDGKPKVVIDPRDLIGRRRGGDSDYYGVPQFLDTVVDFLPDDPDHILMSFGKNHAFKVGVFKINVNSLNSKLVRHGMSGIQHWTSDLRGELRVGEGRSENGETYNLIIRDANGDDWNSHKKYPGLDADTNIYGFMQDPNEMVIGAYNGKDTLGFYIYDLAQKRQTRKIFHNEFYDADSLIYSADGKKVVGVRYTAEAPKKEFFDPVYKSAWNKIKAKLDGFNVYVIDQTPDARLSILKISSPSMPSMVDLYDSQTGKLSSLISNYPELKKVPQGEVVTTKYTARDDTKIPAYVTVPAPVSEGKAEMKNLPFIIMPHGGPGARDTKDFDNLAQFMASRGYAVLQMDFRGSTGYGREFREAGRKNWVIMQDDVEDGVNWLIRKGYADPKRICIVGWSYGGYAALMAAVKNPELYACAASIAGVTDLQDMIRDMKKYRFGRVTAKNSILAGFEDKDDLKENSPVKRADEFVTPVFLAHGTKDSVVHFDQFTRMKRALKKSKSKKVFVEVKNGDHSLSTTEQRLQVFSALDKFLNQYLGVSAVAP